MISSFRRRRLCRNSVMPGQNPTGPGFASPFFKGGMMGISSACVVSENHNPPCPPLENGGMRKILRLRHSLFRRGDVYRVFRPDVGISTLFHHPVKHPCRVRCRRLQQTPVFLQAYSDTLQGRKILTHRRKLHSSGY